MLYNANGASSSITRIEAGKGYKAFYNLTNGSVNQSQEMKPQVEDVGLKASLMESLIGVEDGKSPELASSGVYARDTICNAFPSLVNEVTWSYPWQGIQL